MRDAYPEKTDANDKLFVFTRAHEKKKKTYSRVSLQRKLFAVAPTNYKRMPHALYKRLSVYTTQKADALKRALRRFEASDAEK